MGIELGHNFPRTAPALRAVLAAHDLALVSGWYSAALLQRDENAEMAAMRPHLELLKALDAEVLIIAETSNAIHGDRGVTLSAGRCSRVMTGRIRRAADGAGRRTAAEGLTLVYHHHMGTVVQSEADIDRLMDRTGPALKLLLDTGHATFAGADPLALARRHRRSRRPCALQGRPARLMGRHGTATGAFSTRRRRRVHRAGRRHGRFYPRARRFRIIAVVVIEAEQDPAKANPLITRGWATTT